MMTTIKQQIEAVKTYEDFAKLYDRYARELMGQKPETVGVSICAAQLADLSDAFPEFEARYDNEH
jgi:hypothetical protein